MHNVRRRQPDTPSMRRRLTGTGYPRRSSERAEIGLDSMYGLRGDWMIILDADVGALLRLYIALSYLFTISVQLLLYLEKKKNSRQAI